MKCSNCGKEMRKGYLFSSKDGVNEIAEAVKVIAEWALSQERRRRTIKVYDSQYRQPDGHSGVL